MDIINRHGTGRVYVTYSDQITASYGQHKKFACPWGKNRAMAGPLMTSIAGDTRSEWR
jgi:hypothetical protein